MITILAALALAAISPAHDEALVRCLAHLSNAPEYRTLTTSELAASHAFFDSAEGSYCSSEASPYWKQAHGRARAELGLPAKGRPGRGQQEIAEREMHSILRQAWQAAQPLRANPPPLSEAKMSDFALAWLLNERNAAVLEKDLHGPIACVAKGAAEGRATFSAGGVTPSTELASSCGYDAAAEQIAAMLRGRFPNAPPEFAPATATAFLEQMALWASLSAPNMR